LVKLVREGVDVACNIVDDCGIHLSGLGADCDQLEVESLEDLCELVPEGY
jgi:hypothetical protein